MSLDAQSFNFVRDLVRQDSAIMLDDDKAYLVESRLLPLARQAGAGDVDSYVRKVRTNMSPAVRRDLVEALTTNETSFFRDSEPFRVLANTVLPDLLSRRPGGGVSVWSAASSSGQEAYSIVMTALSTPGLERTRMSVLGTDLSRQMVQRARDGFYSQLEVNRGLPAAHLVRFFERSGSGWRVTENLRSMVRFEELNLIHPLPVGTRFDIVFLRNVLIYFEPEMKRQILARVRSVLAPDGYLVLGAAESTIGLDGAWERQAVGRTSLYRLRKDQPQ